MKYTEEKATVILVSDGRETCDLDPCSVGRRLEDAGVDFTAHVIGFDISNARDRAELQCLAEETGGTFRTASNADELGEALKVIAEPDPVSVTFRAIEGQGGPLIESQLIWTLGHAQKTYFDTQPQANNFTLKLLEGKGHVEVMRPEDEMIVKAEFMVNTADMTVTLVLPQLQPQATLNAPAQVEVGETFTVVWDGPNKQISGGGDYIAISKIGSNANTDLTYEYTKDSENNTVKMIAPVHPGTYELRYVLNNRGNNRVLAMQNLLVTPVTASVDFSNPAQAGGRLAVTWQGPARKINGGGDYIALSKPGSKSNDEITYAYIKDGENNVVDLEVPTTPGTYEVRYILNGSDKIILSSKEVQVVPVKATLEFTSPAPAGGKLAVTWSGPAGDSDVISIAQAGMKINQDITYNYIHRSDGNVLEINVPTAPGTYELRYIQAGNQKKMITVQQLDVVPMTASLKASETANRGEIVQVSWSGPKHYRDTIIIAKADSDSAEAFASVAAGSPASLYAPMVKGDYEIRYIYGPLNKVLATIPLSVQ